MHVIPFTGEVSKGNVGQLLRSVNTHYGQGCVIVDSPGGEFEFFSLLAPPLARAGFVSIGVKVASAAILLQLLGRERLALPDSTFFFHEVRTIVGQYGEISLYDIERALDIEREMKERWGVHQRELVENLHRRLADAQSWMLSFIAEQTGLSSGTFINLMRNNVTLSAPEALRYGVVHRIISQDEFSALTNRMNY